MSHIFKHSWKLHLRPGNANGGHAHLHRLMFLSGGFDARLARIESRCRLDMQPTPRLLQPFCDRSLKRIFVQVLLGLHGVGSKTWSAIQLWGVMYIEFSQSCLIMSGNKVFPKDIKIELSKPRNIQRSVEIEMIQKRQGPDSGRFSDY